MELMFEKFGMHSIRYNTDRMELLIKRIKNKNFNLIQNLILFILMILNPLLSYQWEW